MKVTLYHANCPDGRLAAEIVGGDLFQAVGHYVTPQVPPGSAVTCVDWSPTAEQAKAWVAQGCHVTILDHHKTAWDEWEGVDVPGVRYHYSSTRSGAELAWWAYDARPVPHNVRAVGAFDTNRMHDPAYADGEALYAWFEQAELPALPTPMQPDLDLGRALVAAYRRLAAACPKAEVAGVTWYWAPRALRNYCGDDLTVVQTDFAGTLSVRDWAGKDRAIALAKALALPGTRAGGHLNAAGCQAGPRALARLEGVWKP